MKNSTSNISTETLTRNIDITTLSQPETKINEITTNFNGIKNTLPNRQRKENYEQ